MQRELCRSQNPVAAREPRRLYGGWCLVEWFHMEKFARVVDVIGRCQKDGFEGQVDVIYMFYDMEGSVPSITRDAAYSVWFKPYILETLF